MAASAIAPAAAQAARPEARRPANDGATEGRGPKPIFIQLTQQADLRDLNELPVGSKRLSEAVTRMREVASVDQDKAVSQIRSELQGIGIDAEVDVLDRLWLTNAMVVKVGASDRQIKDKSDGKFASIIDLVKSAGGVSAADTIDNLKVSLQPVEYSTPTEDARRGADATKVPWNLKMIGADQAWKAGATGEGVVVANVDTGVDVSHPALWSKYRGHDTKKGFTHERNYVDPYSPPRKLGGPNPLPVDDDGHGTHTMGSSVGNDGVNGPIGVAPDAKFVAAKGLAAKGGDLVSLLKSMQYLVAPTDNFNQEHPTSAPHIVNHSWGGPGPRLDFTTALRNMAAAGIVNVISAGNNGQTSDAQNLGDPGMHTDAITVGAVDKNRKVASFSSKGPSPVSGEWKPLVVAPGVAINSSMPGGRYATASGTSMAAPHVTGALAVVDDALADRKQPFLDLDDAKFVLQHMTRDIGKRGPDDASGYGIIDLRKMDSAIDKLLLERKKNAKS